ncbi:spliceosome-associated protein CWC27 homolog [Diadema antillarum]|uniref:spliceosome-associated protein CWC27 homolog n=1 Tax=Diadema antillarum TaxID=105358 RepID=UPI003A8C6396
MSNIYIQEPPTNGKVLLKTTCGDIDIELWSKETPKACRNFVQLCMEGYYDGTIFHRIIKDFMAQCGDPTGTGEGGESIYGHPFKDEFHSRLRFVRRGLIAMANAGPNDNGSQFFITLGPCEHLRNKHTLFGKIVGDTLFNAMKLGEVEIGEDDRPLYPPKIKSAQVLANPFDDIEPRQLKKSKNDKEEKKSKSKSKATKNFSLLSFGEEAEENEEEISVASQAMKNKSKSMHDLVDDPRLSSVPAVEQEQGSKKTEKSHLKEDKEKEEQKKESKEMADRVRARLSEDKKDPKKEQEYATPRDQMMSRKEELKEESRRLQKELREGKKRKEREANGKKEDNDKEENDESKSQGGDELSEFHAQKKKFKAMKKSIAKKGSSREDQTLAMLAKFQNKLHTALLTKKPDEKTERGEEMEKNEEKEEDGKDDREKEDEGDIGDDWMTHSLQFENHETKVKDANVRDADTFAIYDPRNPMNKRRREDSKKKIKERR